MLHIFKLKRKALLMRRWLSFLECTYERLMVSGGGSVVRFFLEKIGALYAYDFYTLLLKFNLLTYKKISRL